MCAQPSDNRDQSRDRRPAPATTEPAGTPFGRYRLLAQLGAGAMGVVWKAWDMDRRRAVALKQIRPERLGDDHAVARFQREARLASRLRHPNVTAVLDVGFVGAIPFLAMEYVEGRSLADFLAETRAAKLAGAPEALARLRDEIRVLAEVAGAVGSAHAQGIIHRDLKPANVLLDRAGRAFVTDFGLAKEVGCGPGNPRELRPLTVVTVAGAALGTPSYMSPEQADGDIEHIGPASDVWSLGVILYEILTGRLPFGEGSPLAILWAILQKEPEPPRRLHPAVPEALEAICLRALAKEAGGRFASGEGVAAALAGWLAAEAPRAESAADAVERLRAQGEARLDSLRAASGPGGRDTGEVCRQALEDFAAALRIDAQSAAALAGRADARRKLAQIEAAAGRDVREDCRAVVADYTAALERDPRLALARHQRGVAWTALADAELRARGDPSPSLRHAIADFDECLRHAPENARALLHRANAWSELGRFEARQRADPRAAFRRALADFDEAFRREPALETAKSSRAETWRRLGEAEAGRGGDPAPCYAGAEADYRAAIAAGQAAAWLGLGVVHRLQGRYDEAAADFERGGQAVPEQARWARAQASETRARRRAADLTGGGGGGSAPPEPGRGDPRPPAAPESPEGPVPGPA
ncbi:MAG: protein kinase [Planctomycetes bacterium]|nr:protein kinase [Planctomycetota bacterium]